MDLRLKGKAVLITGGSRGIGLACAEGFAAEGCRIAIAARDAGALGEAETRIRERTGARAHCIEADLSSLAGVATMVATAHRLMGRIDVLVNNAGAIRAGAFLQIPDAQWIEDWTLKPLGYVRAAREVFQLMMEQGGGQIINVIGSAVRQVIPNYLVGGAANAALVNFTKGLSELGAR